MTANSRHDQSRRAPRWASLVVLGSVASSVAAVWIGTALRQVAHPPSCYGIGWGCEPDPGATAFLAGVLVGLPAIVIGLALTWILWAVGRRLHTMDGRWLAWTPAAILTAGSLYLWAWVALEVLQ